MASDKINKMLAFSLVSKMIEQGRNADAGFKDYKDISFKDLESLYADALEEVKACPEVREELVESLKNYQEEHGDLNKLYSAKDIADDPGLQAIVGL